MTIATKIGSLIVKDGKLAENCGCCGGWTCCPQVLKATVSFSFSSFETVVPQGGLFPGSSAYSLCQIDFSQLNALSGTEYYLNLSSNAQECAQWNYGSTTSDTSETPWVGGIHYNSSRNDFGILAIVPRRFSLLSKKFTAYNCSSTPGGYTFQQHSIDVNTLNYIQQGGWDYVVLQQQSQMPSFPDNDVIANTYPYARFLDSMINEYNDCAETVFYMTWGRQNGDASNCANWPPVCTYQGMDSLLRLRYTNMANDNNAILS
ncbi:hypothetical protein EBZ39_19080, partial [bacterium]|nr:hypothetical protein [bacterium]